MGRLFFGDNLGELEAHVDDDSVDLIYLDPPFNSKAQYHVLFKPPESAGSTAQVEAFLDAWSWGESAEAAFERVIEGGGSVARIMTALRQSMGHSDMMAYLVMMACRLSELHRVLKPTGTLFLHCDPAASHYLKVLLDATFGPERFTNEIVWERTTPKGLAFSRFASNHDVILMYRKGDRFCWNAQYAPYSEEYLKRYNLIDEQSGRRFQATSLINPNPDRPNLTYEFAGHRKVWRWTKDRMKAAADAGLIHFPPSGGVPREKRFLDKQEGVPISSVWTDISPVNARAQERIGYPTQKPLALMRRVIGAATNKGDLVLDPFCGCGTTVHAAEEMGRDWIGIDITHHAITVIEDRLQKSFPKIKIPVEGRPLDLAGARELARRDKYQFQWWANWLFGVSSYRTKKGPDKGIDGEIYFKNGPRGVGRIIISAKGEKKTGVIAVRELASVLEDQKAELGVLVTLSDPTPDMIARAASAGFVTTAHGKFPRIQLAPISSIFDNRKPSLPVHAPIDELRAPRQRRIKKKNENQMSFTFSFSGGLAATVAEPGELAALNPKFAQTVQLPPEESRQASTVERSARAMRRRPKS